MESPERVPPQRIAPISQAGSSLHKSDPKPQPHESQLTPCDRLKPAPKAEDHCEYGTKLDANSETNLNHTAAKSDTNPSAKMDQLDVGHNRSKSKLDANPSAKVDQLDVGHNRSKSKLESKPVRKVGKRPGSRRLNRESLLSACRICMASNLVSISIFDNEETLRMCEKVMSCASVRIDRYDGLPDRICQACITDLETAFSFKVRCEKSDASLRQKLGLKVKTIHKTEFVLIDCDGEVDEPIGDRQLRRSRTETSIVDDFLDDRDFSAPESDDPSYETPVPKKKKVECKSESASTKVKQGSSSKKVKKVKEETVKDDEISAPPRKRKPYPCPDCYRTFTCPNLFKAHTAIHTKKKEYKCVLCSETFVYTKDLYAHNKTVHLYKTDKPKIDHVPKSFPCSTCNKVFRKEKNFKEHEALHLREKKYTCEGCSLGFIHKNGLNHHMKREHPELCRPYTCKICNSSFELRSALERHVDCHRYNDPAAKLNDSAKKPPLVNNLFEGIPPFTPTCWSDWTNPHFL